MSEKLGIYKAIIGAMSELAGSGISKDKKNLQQGYAFRGIDDVYNALAPVLASNGLCVLPRILSRTVTERTTQRGNALFYVVVEAEFDLIAAEDGSQRTVRTFGEAMDSADKATNKAMSAAYKYAMFQTFCIPTEGHPDADAETPEEVQPKSEPPSERPIVPPAIVQAFRAAAKDGDKAGLLEMVNNLSGQEKVAIWAQLTPAQHAQIKQLMEAN